MSVREQMEALKRARAWDQIGYARIGARREELEWVLGLLDDQPVPCGVEGGKR